MTNHTAERTEGEVTPPGSNPGSPGSWFEEQGPVEEFKLLIAGGGPAGTGLLINAARRGQLEALLKQGVALVEKGSTLGAGGISNYVMNANSLGVAFLECLDEINDPLYDVQPVLMQDDTKSLESQRYKSPALTTIGGYLSHLGEALKKSMARVPESSCMLHTSVDSVRVYDDHVVTSVTSMHKDGSTKRKRIQSGNVFLALGGHQAWNEIVARPITTAGVPVSLSSGGYIAKTIMSSEFVTAQGSSRARTTLQGGNTKVVIVGGSHSAFSAAWVLVRQMAELGFEPGDITILCRSLPKLFYMSVEDAAKDGYTDFKDDDLCPVTGRVHRYGGLRFDQNTLCRQVMGMDPEAREERIRVLQFDPKAAEDAATVKQLLDEAAVIVPAFGYHANFCPIFKGDTQETYTPLVERTAGNVVDSQGRVMLAPLGPSGEGVPGDYIPRVFACGLGSGIKVDPKVGGEPSFKGRADGVWLYQHDVGDVMFKNLAAPLLPHYSDALDTGATPASGDAMLGSK